MILTYDWKKILETGPTEVYAGRQDFALITLPTYTLTNIDIEKAMVLEQKNIAPVFSLAQYIIDTKVSTLFKL